MANASAIEPRSLTLMDVQPSQRLFRSIKTAPAAPRISFSNVNSKYSWRTAAGTDIADLLQTAFMGVPLRHISTLAQ
jgi:hypothetical protein